MSSGPRKSLQQPSDTESPCHPALSPPSIYVRNPNFPSRAQWKEPHPWKRARGELVNSHQSSQSQRGKPHLLLGDTRCSLMALFFPLKGTKHVRPELPSWTSTPRNIPISCHKSTMLPQDYVLCLSSLDDSLLLASRWSQTAWCHLVLVSLGGS